MGGSGWKEGLASEPGAGVSRNLGPQPAEAAAADRDPAQHGRGQPLPAAWDQPAQVPQEEGGRAGQQLQCPRHHPGLCPESVGVILDNFVANS